MTTKIDFEKVKHESLESIRFNNICKAVESNYPGIESIRVDRFILEGYDYAYLVVTFTGGSISVRNVRWNSLSANMAELAKLIRGGYYDEVETYKKLKQQLNANTV